jgi:cytidylate kinase
MFARALERGEVAGGGEAGLVTAGSGGSTISATSKAGVGELAGGCVSSGTVFSRLPASAGMMLYELSGMESEEHGFPARDQCNMLVYKVVNGRLRIIVH